MDYKLLLQLKDRANKVKTELPPEVAASSWTADSAAADRARTVTVRTGDTLWALCRTYGLTMRQMLAYNPQIRDPDLIHTGEELRIG